MKNNISIILVSPRNPLNIGAAARAMGNFGLKDLRVVNPYEANWKEAVTAVNADQILKNAKVFNSLAEAAADCNLIMATTSLKNRKAGQKVVSLPLIKDFLADYEGDNIGIVFGQEKTGLTAKEMELANVILNIPTSSEIPSINLAQAVILCCYELSKAKPAKIKAKSSQAPSLNDYLLLEKDLEAALENKPFPPTLNAKIRHAKLRDIFQKSNLSKENLFFIKALIDQLSKK